MNLLKRIVDRPGVAVWVLVLMAALVRVLNVAFLVDSPLFLAPTSDEAEHFELARRIAEGGDWLGWDEGLMMRPPLFAWVLAGLFGVFGVDYMVVHGLVLLSDVVAVGLWYLVALRCMGRGAAFVAGLGMAGYWGFVHFASTGYMESFALALNGGLVLCLVEFFRRNGERRTENGERIRGNGEREEGGGAVDSGQLTVDSGEKTGGEAVDSGQLTVDSGEERGAGGHGRLQGWWLLVVGGLLAGLGVLVRPTLLIVMPWLGVLVAWVASRGMESGEWRTENGERGVGELGAGGAAKYNSALPESGDKSPQSKAWAGDVKSGLALGGAAECNSAIPESGEGLAQSKAWRWVRGIAAGGVLALFTVVGMSPNALRHWVLFGEWVPLGVNGEINTFLANTADGWGCWVYSPGIEFYTLTDSVAVKGGMPLTVEAAREYWGEVNRENFWRDPAGAVGLFGRKFLRTWNAYENAMINNFREHWRLSPVERWALPSWLVIPFGFAGLVLALGAGVRRRDKGERGTDWLGDDDGVERARVWGRLLLAGWVVFYFVGVALYHVNSRHRLPAMPGLVLLGAYAASRLFDGVGRTDNGERVGRFSRWVVAGLVLAGMVLAWLPVIPDWMAKHEEWWTHVNKGVALGRLDRPEEAAEEFRAATVVRPDKLEGWRQLALAEERLGNEAEAARAQTRLVELLREQYGEYGASWAEEVERLTVLRLAAGDVEGAKGAAAELLGLAPGHFRSFLTAARVAVADGDSTGALALIERARRAAGGNAEALRAVEEAALRAGGK